MVNVMLQVLVCLKICEVTLYSTCHILDTISAEAKFLKKILYGLP